MVITLFARSKYESKEARSDKAMQCMLDQQLYTQHSRLDRALRRLEHPRPYEYTKESADDGKLTEIPNETLVVYINLNARNQVEALIELNRRVMTAMASMLTLGEDAVTQHDIPDRFDRALVQQVHKSKQIRLFVEIDIDTKDRQRLAQFLQRAQLHTPDFLDRVAFTVETRGGYHLVFPKDKFPSEMYKTCASPDFAYRELSRDGKMVDKKYFDIRGDVCVPIPGTLQGGFPVRLVDVRNIAGDVDPDAKMRDSQRS